MRNIILALGLVFMMGGVSTMAQNEADVLRFSYTQPLGSVRSMGMGGAYGALGADLSSASINPAGMGMYRLGDAGATIGIFSNKTNTNSLSDGAINNLGIALVTPSVNPDIPFFTLAYSRSTSEQYTGVTSTPEMPLPVSLLHTFLQSATGTSFEALDNSTHYPFTASLAWYAFLLDPDGASTDQYVTPFDTQGIVNTSYRIEESGNITDDQISAGFTYKDIVSIGATVSKSTITYSSTTIREETITEADSDLASWDFSENLNIDGVGFNIKLGAIFHANWLKLGIAWHSGTNYSLEDTYWNTINSYWKDGTTNYAQSLNGSYSYRLKTPQRLMLSSAIVIGKNLIISTDYESVDFSSGRLSGNNIWLASEYDFRIENDAVEDSYVRTHLMRMGVEARINKEWRARAGAGYMTSPFSEEAGVQGDASRYSASLGCEYRMDAKYLGIAWTRSWFERDLYITDPELQGEPINLATAKGMLVVGCGVRF